MFDPSRFDTPSPGPASRQRYQEPRHATADFTEADDDDEEESNDDEDDAATRDHPRYMRYRHDGGMLHDGDARRSSATIIPLFSSSHLGKC